MVTISSVAVVAIVLIVIVLINQAGGGNATAATPVPQAILTAVENPSSSVVIRSDPAVQPAEMIRLPASAMLATVDGKPQVVFVGAEYCPYCAAERWSMVMWLSRFGTFKNLPRSSPHPPTSIPTLTRSPSTSRSYTSQYIDFSSNEVEDRNRSRCRR